MPLSSSTRKLIGLVLLLSWIVVYAGAVAFVAVAILPRNVFVELPFYAVAGLAWAFPARYLIIWMNRPDRPHRPRARGASASQPDLKDPPFAQRDDNKETDPQ